MKTWNKISAGVTLALTLALHGCTSGSTEHEMPRSAPEAVLEIPADVQERFGADTSTLADSGEDIIKATYGAVGRSDHCGPREGEEAMYYEPVRPYMDAAAYERLLGYASTADHRANALVPQANSEGVWASLDGVTYTVDEELCYMVIEDADPTVSLADDDSVLYTLPITIRTFTSPSTLQYSAVETLMLVPDAKGDWVISGWHEEITTPLHVVQW